MSRALGALCRARGGYGSVRRGDAVGRRCGDLLQRLRHILEVDPVDRRAVLQPGVTNLDTTKAAAPHGLYYAPDPSSQQVCTIGGNVAENSGGAHCLK